MLARGVLISRLGSWAMDAVASASPAASAGPADSTTADMPHRHRKRQGFGVGMGESDWCFCIAAASGGVVLCDVDITSGFWLFFFWYRLLV